MKRKYRAKKYRFLSADKRTTRVIFTPQILYKEGWCCFPDHSTESELIEYKERGPALQNAKELYEYYHAKGQC